MKKFDLVVIGTGSAGLVAATTAKRLGLKTAMIEKHKIGGECTHYGCVPSKAFLNAAKAFHALKNTTSLGIPEVKLESEFDFAKVMEKVDDIVQGIYEHETPQVFEKQGIKVFIHADGARFLDNNSVQIGKEVVEAKNFIICTGSSPHMIPFEGSEQVNYLHNENFWKLRKLPRSIIFIGGGVISVELGQSLARFGCEVNIIDIADRILPPVDEEVGQLMTEILEKEGINIITSAGIQKFESVGNTYKMIYKFGEETFTLIADEVFMGVGRAPNVNGLGLEKARIEYERAGIKTNKYLQTTVSNIYACGDVTALQKFTHTASHQANICIHNIINGNSRENDLTALPWAVFTEPELAHVGLLEKEAKEKFGERIQIFRVDATIDRYVTDRKTTGFLKVIFDENDLVIGADAIGQHAGEWIHVLTIALKNKIPAAVMADTIFAYPTYSEIVKKAFTRFLRSKEKI